MSEMFFVIKVFIFTLVVVAVMQVKVGDRNIEQRSQSWLHSSSLVHVLNSVSVGAGKVFTDSYHYVGNKLSAIENKADTSKIANTSKKQSSFSFKHGLDIRHELHQAKEKIEEEASKASDEIKSEL